MHFPRTPKHISTYRRWQRLGQLGALTGACVGIVAMSSISEANESTRGHYEAQYQAHYETHNQEHSRAYHYAQDEHHRKDYRAHIGIGKGGDFIRRTGSVLRLGGEEFRFAGSNNYYLMYSSEAMVDDVLTTAEGQGFNVMRTWASNVIGQVDGTGSITGATKPNGVYFQYWDGQKPAINDGVDGLAHLDYVIAKAGELGIRLVMPLVNNWDDFGGMNQYVAWAGGNYHDDFYTNPVIKGWYKEWVYHLLNRTNSITGIKYKNDPTIMMWELANEPRCGGGEAYGISAECSTDTLVDWADEMSQYVRQIDNNHLIAVGDEGFYCNPGSGNWIEDCGEGVDTLALSALPDIDVMSFHLYPNSWGQTQSWANEYIVRHFDDAAALNKPAMLGEYGWKNVEARNSVYKEWGDLVMASGGAGALYWILSGQRDDGTLYPDYDGFTVYCPGPVCSTITNFATMMNQDAILEFAPVADDNVVTTKFNKATVLNATANDVAYSASIVTGSVDLDPMTAGQQSTLSIPQGSFAAQPDGTVSFVPTAGYHGTVRAGYVVQDSKGRLSNEAYLVVTVESDPDGPKILHSFENDTEGFSGGNGGTVARSSEFATDGTSSLKVTSAAGGEWFGTVYTTPLNLTKKTILEWDVYSTNGTSQQLSIQLGTEWDWCEGGGYAWANGGSTTTVSLDLTTLACNSGLAPNLADVRALNIFMGNGGSPVYVDNIRAKADPTLPATVLVHSFEGSTEGFGPLEGVTGTVSLSTEHATEGTQSLKVDATGGGWFGTNYATPRNFLGSKYLEWDVYSENGTSQQLSIQLGTSWDWCEGGGWAWVNGGNTASVSIDLESLSCNSGDAPNLADVRALNIFMGNGGSPVFIDNIHAVAAPNSNGDVVLHTFESGTEGFAGGSGGTVEQSAEHATQGDFSLKATSAGGEWFGVNYSGALDFSSKTVLAWDIYTDNGTSQQLAVKVGSGWTWCEAGGWAWTNGGVATTVQLNLSDLACEDGSTPDLTQVQSLNIFMGNGGSPVYIDNVRLQ